jgi:sugar/nucleoside kinase (ribokinase family)
MGQATVIVAGHICLDILPGFASEPRFDAEPTSGSQLPFDFNSQFTPGGLTRVGPAVFSTGGAVANTGLALHKLGVQTALVARSGDDLFGSAVRQIVAGFDPHLADGIAAIPGETTAYTIIISPPGVDRLFLHCPGANDRFRAEDIPSALLEQVRLLHFGYPPVMESIYRQGGAELERIFQRAKTAGVTTSLDLCSVDPASEAGRIDWTALLARTLPFVDLFAPSLDELLFMLDRPAFDQAAGGGGVCAWLLAQPQRLSALGERLLALGAKMTLIKLGNCGVYLRTARHEALDGFGRGQPAGLYAWADRELWAPCFRVPVAGTTGSGDATIAGFIAALLRGLSPTEALTAAVAVGACSVEAIDALRGIPDWETMQHRVAAGWERLLPAGRLPGWRWTGEVWERG